MSTGIRKAQSQSDYFPRGVLRTGKFHVSPRSITLGSTRLPARIFLPQLILTILIVAVISLFVLLRLSIDAREYHVTRELAAASQLASERLDIYAQFHNQLLVSLQQKNEDTGNLSKTDSAALITLLAESSENMHVDQLLVLDHEGNIQLHLQARHIGNGDSFTGYEEYVSDRNHVALAIVNMLQIDSKRNTPLAGLGTIRTEPYLFTGISINSESENTSPGYVIVGNSLQLIMSDLQKSTGADVVFYTEPGHPLDTTIPDWELADNSTNFVLDPGTYASTLITNPTSSEIIRSLDMHRDEYRVTYRPIMLNSEAGGVLGIIRPINFPIPAKLANSDTALFLGFVLAVSLYIVGGVIISARLLSPVYQTLNAEFAKSSAILSSIADGVIVRDPDGKIIVTNSAAREMLTNNGQFDPAPLATIAPLAAKSPVEVAWIEVGECTLSVSVASVEQPEGEHVGDVLVLHDVTDRVLAERTKNSFLSQVGHELRTPLTAIQGYADALRQGGERLSSARRDRASTAIFEQTQTLSHIINQIIDLAALESGQIVLHLEELDLHALVSAALTEWRETLEEANLTVDLDLNEPHIHVNGDKKRLRYVVDALIRNAHQFSPQGGALQVHIKRENGSVCLCISDPGVGISKHDLPRVFERFYRGEPVDQNGIPVDVRGVGQGLYVVKEIVEAHGGDVHVESEVGVGSKFEICLPVR